MSLRNLDAAIVNGEGDAMQENINGVTRLPTVRQMVRAGLNTGPMKWEERAVSFIPDPSVGAEEKLRMYDLATKCKAEGPVDLKSEEIILIKKCIGHMVPFMYGQICAALEADIPPPAK